VQAFGLDKIEVRKKHQAKAFPSRPLVAVIYEPSETEPADQHKRRKSLLFR
jgi:hypothetical protein